MSSKGVEHPASALSHSVVVVFGSEGSAKAVADLLRPLNPDAPLTVVVHQSRKDGTRGRAWTDVRLPVAEAAPENRLEPGRIVLVPEGARAVFRNGCLLLEPPESGAATEGNADVLFLSAAEQAGRRAIGVLLSGRGTDGLQGLRAIREAGGVVLVQDPASAEQPALPARALAAGLGDRVLSPAELGHEVLRLAGRTMTAAPSKEDLRPVLSRLLEKTGVDFSSYRLGTLQRRTSRRMGLLGARSVGEFVGHLDAHPEEVDELFEDLLIHVTGFFRDPETYRALAEAVFPEILKAKKPAEAIRVWVPGCSTGEEAYSIAIVLLECLDRFRAVHPVQIFASDVSRRAVAQARQGLYPDAIRRHVSDARLKKHFTRTEGGFQVVKRLREMCIFVQHDLTRNPPFSRLDLLSCRNLLIYFEPDLQERVLQIFHLALRPGGYLALGDSESPGGSAQLFGRAPKAETFYVRKPGAPSLRMGFVPSPPPIKSAAAPSGLALGPQDVARHAADALLSRHVPAAFVVDRELEILHVWGRTSDVLGPPPGTPQLNLLKMLREDLRSDVRLAVHQAGRSGKAVRRDGLRLRDVARRRTTAVEVEPLPPPEGSDERHFLVLIRDVPAPAAKPPGKRGSVLREKALEEEVRRLREDLSTTIEYSQSFVKEFEAVNASLSGANEEILSTNEELRSTNEELETAKEELQTANDEISARNQALGQLTADLTNLLSSSEAAILMLDPARRIRRATPRAQALLNILPSDEGRPLADLKISLSGVDFDVLLDEADRSRTLAREVRDRSGRWYSLQVRPYRTATGREEGTVVSLHDIDSLKRREEEREQTRRVLEESERRFRRLADDAPVMIWMSGPDARCSYFNKPWLDFRGRTLEQERGEGWTEGVHPDDHERCAKTYLDAFHARRPFEREYRLRRADGAWRWITDRGVPLGLADGIFVGFIGACLDITERKEAEATSALLASIVHSSEDAIISKDLRGVVMSWNQGAERLFGYAAAEAVGRPITFLIPEERLAEEREILARIAQGQRVAPFETLRRRKDGTLIPISLGVSPVKDPRGKVVGASKVARDISGKKRTEAEILRLNASLERRVEERTIELRQKAARLAEAERTARLGSWDWDIEGNRLSWSEELCRIYGTEAPPDYEGFLERIHPEDRPQVREVVDRAYRSGEPFDFHHRIVRPDGAVRLLHGRGQVVRDGAGRPIRMHGTGQDVTEEREREERERTRHSLEESERKFRMLAENSPDVIGRLDRDLRHLYVNPAAAALLGLPAAEILGKTHRELGLPPERCRDWEEQFRRALAGERLAFELEFEAPGGTRRLDAHLAPEAGPDGRIMSVLGIARDVTERKRAEDDVRRMNADLEQRVRERTLRLEAAVRELETFTYTVAHDLRAPLRAIHRFCDLLREEKAPALDEEGRSWLGHVGAGARRMDALIESLLAYSRIGQGRVAAAVLDLEAAVAKALEPLKGEILERAAAVDLAHPFPKVLADPVLLGQVLANILANALKFVPPQRAPRIRLRTERAPSGVRLWIEDNGIGIEERHRERVFRIFERLHGPDAYPGTGVGLAIVKKAVEQMKGEVGFEPGEPHGTRFYILLPAPPEA